MRTLSFIAISCAIHFLCFDKIHSTQTAPLEIVKPLGSSNTIELVNLAESPVKVSDLGNEKNEIKSNVVVSDETEVIEVKQELPKKILPPKKSAKAAKKIATKLPAKLVAESKQQTQDSSDVKVVVAEIPTNNAQQEPSVVSAQQELPELLASSQIRDGRNLKQLPNNKSPDYPLVDRQNKKEGTTVLLGYVTSAGVIKNIKIENPSGSKTLDASSYKAFTGYRFFPGQEGWIRMPFKFEIKGQAQKVNGLLRTTSMRDKSPERF